MSQSEDAQNYHRLMQLLYDIQMDHGLCHPRDRRACTACNAGDDIEKMVVEYKGPPVVASGVA